MPLCLVNGSIVVETVYHFFPKRVIELNPFNGGAFRGPYTKLHHFMIVIPKLLELGSNRVLVLFLHFPDKPFTNSNLHAEDQHYWFHCVS